MTEARAQNLHASARNRAPAVNIVLCAMLILTIAASLATGASFLSPADLWRGLTGADEAAAIIVREIRLPRTILAAASGGILGLAGAAIQGLTRNPLAEPAVLGTPQAAALGAVLVLYNGLAAADSIWIALAAIIAAGLATAVIFSLLRRGDNIVTLLLAGLGIGSLASAALSFVISLSPNPYSVMEIVFWLMGSFEDRSLEHVAVSLPFMVLAALILIICRKGYSALTLGEDVAASLGTDIRRTTMLTAAGVSLGVGASVAVAGAIGFVGLIAPHLVRPACGNDPGRILIPAGLCGALIVTLADIAVRVIPATSEIRVGALTALIGAPLFLWLVAGRRQSIWSRLQ